MNGWEIGTPIFIVPIRFWEVQEPGTARMARHTTFHGELIPDDHRDRHAYVFHDGYGHNVYVERAKCFLTREEAIAKEMELDVDLPDPKRMGETAAEFRVTLRAGETPEVAAFHKYASDHGIPAARLGDKFPLNGILYRFEGINISARTGQAQSWKAAITRVHDGKPFTMKLDHLKRSLGIVPAFGRAA